MHVIRVFAALAVVCVTLAVLLLGPIHATGVRGTALHPRYIDFGWASYQPVSGNADAVAAALAAAGITRPDVAVERRRAAATAVAGLGFVASGFALLLVRRIRQAPAPIS
jgi:hypothetical protein